MPRYTIKIRADNKIRGSRFKNNISRVKNITSGYIGGSGDISHLFFF